MKTKNIFLTAISALFIFAACTEEKIIDEPGVSGKGDYNPQIERYAVLKRSVQFFAEVSKRSVQFSSKHKRHSNNL